MLLLVLAACSDIALVARGDDKPGHDLDTATEPPPVDTAPTPEECNGGDDDGDGLVDEGFPDDDGNGRADCLDSTCPSLDAGVAGPVDPVEACAPETYEAPADPWDIVEKWTWLAGSDAVYSYVPAMVGQLDDDDGDGAITDADTPDIVIDGVLGGGTDGSVAVIDGATGAERWEVAGMTRVGGTLIADVDGDGTPNVLALETNYPGVSAVLFDPDGAVVWRSAPFGVSVYGFSEFSLPAIADLDGDGIPEVIVADEILDGATGALRGAVSVSSGRHDRGFLVPEVADLDLDGSPEILVDGRVSDASGALLWSVSEPLEPSDLFVVWMAPVQADADPEAEVAYVGSDFVLLDTDGSELVRTTVNTGYYREGVPCAADLDGDGQTEIAWAEWNTFAAYELDGTRLWSIPSDDESGMGGCSTADLDGDGRYEVLYADEGAFYVLDGATGAIRFETAHFSTTGFDYPVVADVDGDRIPEVLEVGREGDGVVLRVYGQRDDRWAPVSGGWPAWDYPSFAPDAGGAVPTALTDYWNDPATFHGRPVALLPGLPDLQVTVTDTCVADCEWGPVRVAIQASNHGAVDAPADVPVALYAVDDTGPREVARVLLPAVPAGQALDGIEITLSPEDVGSLGFEAVVDPEDTVEECDEANTSDLFPAVCP